MHPEAILLENSSHYEGLLEFLRVTGWNRDPEGFLQCAERILWFAHRNHVGRFADGALENSLLTIGTHLDDILKQQQLVLTQQRTPHLRKQSRRHVLHVATAVYRVGRVAPTTLH